MLGTQLIPIDLFFARLSIHGVQVQPVNAGDQAVSLVQVTAQLIGISRLSRVIASRC